MTVREFFLSVGVCIVSTCMGIILGWTCYQFKLKNTPPVPANVSDLAPLGIVSGKGFNTIPDIGQFDVAGRMIYADEEILDAYKAGAESHGPFLKNQEALHVSAVRYLDHMKDKKEVKDGTYISRKKPCEKP